VSRRPLGCLYETVETLILAVIIFLALQTFVAQPYCIQQESMEHTLEPGQCVLIDKLTPHFATYTRGDIVVFNPPPAWDRQSGGIPYIKRVIGVGGDTVAIRGGTVYVNGVQLAEAYLYAEGGQPGPTEPQTGDHWSVPSGQLFVMGDHRAVSADSRAFGTVPISYLVGRAWLRYLPLDTFGILGNPGHPELASPSPSPGSSVAALASEQMARQLDSGKNRQAGDHRGCAFAAARLPTIWARCSTPWQHRDHR
jgi:signal peptidase I